MNPTPEGWRVNIYNPPSRVNWHPAREKFLEKSPEFGDARKPVLHATGSLLAFCGGIYQIVTHTSTNIIFSRKEQE
jgi:hypothetical protein